MTQNQALKMRAAIAAILSFSKDKRYEVAIQQRYPNIADSIWEVHIFVRNEKKSGFLNCGILAHSIELVSYEFLAIESTYDISTNGEPKKIPSFKIW